MKFDSVYFVNGTAYAGKSTLVKNLAERYGGIACEENYHDALLPAIDLKQFPYLAYTENLTDWHDFIRRTPDEYEAWVRGVSKECELLELQILEKMETGGRPVFVDTNISVETLHRISDRDHVLILLSDPSVSVNRFFERPDREKQFLYRLLLEEPDPEAAVSNFRECLSRINSKEAINAFLNSGFHVLWRDETRSAEETAAIASELLKLR